MIQSEAGFMKQLKLWMLLICFALGFDSSEGKKCCVSRAYAVCWVTPNFWENALTDEKKNHWWSHAKESESEKPKVTFLNNTVYKYIDIITNVTCIVCTIISSCYSEFNL